MTISIQAAFVFGFVATVSLLLNALLIYYIRISIIKFARVSDGIISLKDSVGSFSQHLKFVYELEMYYGDETLKALLEHASTLNDSFEEYEEFYSLFDFDEELEEQEEEDNAAQTQEG
tara:strand:+ start:71 stop:424 length:354 start_codon:yes stop_codon:yes gene_type:complete